MITLLLGGIKSGRTALAESMALAAAERRGQKPLYIACGRASDAEMAQKIARHQATRAGRWLLCERSGPDPEPHKRRSEAGRQRRHRQLE